LGILFLHVVLAWHMASPLRLQAFVSCSVCPALQLSSGDPCFAADGRAVHGEQASAACWPEGVCQFNRAWAMLVRRGRCSDADNAPSHAHSSCWSGRVLGSARDISCACLCSHLACVPLSLLF